MSAAWQAAFTAHKRRRKTENHFLHSWGNWGRKANQFPENWRDRQPQTNAPRRVHHEQKRLLESASGRDTETIIEWLLEIYHGFPWEIRTPGSPVSGDFQATRVFFRKPHQVLIVKTTENFLHSSGGGGKSSTLERAQSIVFLSTQAWLHRKFFYLGLVNVWEREYPPWACLACKAGQR